MNKSRRNTRQERATGNRRGIARHWAGAALLVTAHHALALEPQEIFQKLERSVWTVIAYDRQKDRLGTSSAVVIGPGRAVTTCSVLAKASSVAVSRDNVTYGATLEWPDVDRNLCQLKIANFRAPAVEVADAAALRVGMRVYAIGSPRGLETTLSDGLLSSLRRDGAGQLIALQHSAPTSLGSGGGGLFDSQARLIGVTSGSERNAQNLNFAIPAQLLAELPERGQRALQLWQGLSPVVPAVGAPSAGLDAAAAIQANAVGPPGADNLMKPSTAGRP